MPWASIILTVGFAFRAYGAYHYGNIDVLIVNTVLIMSGPPIYALINYMVLSRILYYVPYLSPLHPGRVLTTFLAMDAVCETLIVNGAQRIVNSRLNQKERNIGETLVKVALIMQASMFVFFLILGGQFQRKATKAGVMTHKLKSVLIVMYISSIVVLARCIYRIVEFFQGYNGEVFRHEVYFWIFEASIMFFNTVMLNVFHPGKRLPRSNKVFLSKEGAERRGPGWKDKRPFLATLLDPFDIFGLVTGKDKKTKFWELSREELEAMNEKDRVERAEAFLKPRTLRHKIFDPFHLFGSTGKFQRLFDWMDGEEPIDTSIVKREKNVDAVHVSSKGQKSAVEV
jgi:hypothetical protein